MVAQGAINVGQLVDNTSDTQFITVIVELCLQHNFLGLIATADTFLCARHLSCLSPIHCLELQH